MITFRNSLHKIPIRLDYLLVHIVGKLNFNQFDFVINKYLNRKETQRNEFTKLVWYEDLLKWTNDKKQEFENTKMNK